MAELAAIALAGNILQFLEVGIKLTHTATRAYQSTDGFIKEDRDFLADTERSRKLACLIQQNQWTPEEHYDSRLDDSLMETAKICEAYASELVTLLDPMRIKSGGFRGLQSIKISMLRQFKARDVRNLEVKMIAARDNLMLALISTSYVQQSSALSAIRQLKQQNAVLEANTTSKLESIENLIQGVASIDADGATMMITHLDNLATEAKQVKRQHKLLRSLRFPTIRQRHSAIMEHHKATFQWIFTSTETGFGEWLESGGGFFWVKGCQDEYTAGKQRYTGTFEELLAPLRVLASSPSIKLYREVDDPAYAITMQPQPLSKERYKRIHQRAKTRLNARCRDLLYVTKNTGEAVFLYQVDFVHRTARDFFLDTGVIDKIIQQRPTQDFNPHLSLCKVMLALTKALTNFQSISTFVADLMYYARTIEDMYGQPDLYRDTPISFGSLTEMFGILDELARVNTERSVTPDVHLLDNLEHLSKDYFKKPRLNNVLAPAVQAGLLLYVEDRLRRHPSELQLNSGRPLLDYALRPGNTAPMLRSPSETVPIIPILKLLLHLGANPNARVDMYDGKTTWGCFLETCQQHAARKRSPEEVEKIAAALELMIDYGARVEGHFGPLTFMELLDEINLPPHWASRIQEMTENKYEKQSLLSGITSWLQWK
ncbi:hypothetical protein FOC1_g10001711 [Fusarium oxysporum f. sp. cubense race 1]|uniref:DUF7791 domain-containing protein n=1 Tax=Fusarium oxysporum f. sp. cubense (strain race 1) TaxID=1229664 RepID=N4UQR4_FUSC1|nr:hypothetical protein FOC1_g10001711 [Fusarium oxysporum f. sp. cubense race 1]